MPDEIIAPAGETAESSTAAPATETEVTATTDAAKPAAADNAGDEGENFEAETLDLNDAERTEWLKTGKLPEKLDAKDAKAPAAKTEPSAGPKPETSSASEAGKEGAQTAADDGQKPKNRGADVRKRQLGDEIAGMLNTRKTVAAEIAELERKKAETVKADSAPAAKPAVADPSEPKEPVFADYPGWEDYDKAMKQYNKDVRAFDAAQADKRIAAALEADRKAQEQRATETRAQEQNKAQVDFWAKNMEGSIKRHPDLSEVVFGADGKLKIGLSPVMDRYILKQELGADLLYHLAKDADDGGDLVERLSKMDDDDAVEELSVIKRTIAAEIEREKKPVLPRAGAKPPVNLGGQNAAAKDELEDAMDTDDFTKYTKVANRREIEARTAAR